MGQTRLDHAPYLTTGDPKTSVETSQFRPGELGHVYIDALGQRWQKVRANTVLTHAPAVKEIWYWVTGHNFVVDSDYTDSEATINAVAGLLPTGATVPTANQYFWLQQSGGAVTVSGITGVNFLAGAVIVGSTTVGQVTCTASGTALVGMPLGTVHTAVDHSGGAGDVVADLDIPSRSYY